MTARSPDDRNNVMLVVVLILQSRTLLHKQHLDESNGLGYFRRSLARCSKKVTFFNWIQVVTTTPKLQSFSLSCLSPSGTQVKARDIIALLP